MKLRPLLVPTTSEHLFSTPLLGLALRYLHQVDSGRSACQLVRRRRA